MPRLIVTIEPRQDRMLRQFAQSSGLPLSRIVREMLERAAKSGYTPGSVSMADMYDDSRRHLPHR